MSWRAAGSTRNPGGSRHPDEFLAANGHTDDSSSPRGAWPVLVFGLVLLGIGGGIGGLMVRDRIRTKRWPTSPRS